MGARSRAAGPPTSDGFRLGALGRTPFGRAGEARVGGEAVRDAAQRDGHRGRRRRADTGIAGVELEERSPNLVPGTRYHWRVRLVYDPVTFPFAERSRWLTMPVGRLQEAMLRTGAAPAGRASTMTIFKVGLGVTIDWTDSSCLEATDGLRSVRRNPGNFASHVPVTCSSSPGTSWNFTPAAGNRYFLLVPVNATREGSYGLGPGRRAPGERLRLQATARSLSMTFPTRFSLPRHPE